MSHSRNIENKGTKIYQTHDYMTQMQAFNNSAVCLVIILSDLFSNDNKGKWE